MKCIHCGIMNKPEAKVCKKCGKPLIIEPLWKPTLKWHLKVLAIIYVCLIIIFLLLNHMLKPFMRKLPAEITPWLQNEQTKNK